MVNTSKKKRGGGERGGGESGINAFSQYALWHKCWRSRPSGEVLKIEKNRLAFVARLIAWGTAWARYLCVSVVARLAPQCEAVFKLSRQVWLNSLASHRGPASGADTLGIAGLRWHMFVVSRGDEQMSSSFIF